MKKLNLNKKGFTLIELLAVIVILALLVAVAVPAVTRYLNTARAGVMSTDAATAISVVRTDVMTSATAAGGSQNAEYTYYTISDINANFLESSKQIKKSPYGANYLEEATPIVNASCKKNDSTITASTKTECTENGGTWTESTSGLSGSYVLVHYKKNEGSYEYCIVLETSEGKRIDEMEANIDSSKVKTETGGDCSTLASNNELVKATIVSYK